MHKRTGKPVGEIEPNATPTEAVIPAAGPPSEPEEPGVPASDQSLPSVGLDDRRDSSEPAETASREDA
jgi:hypothetical protein